MRRKKLLIILIGGSLTVALFCLINRSSQTEGASENIPMPQTIQTSELPASQDDSQHALPTTDSHTQPSPQPEAQNANLGEQLESPSINQLREEVAKNPHVTPPSVLTFAAQLGPKMEQALKSEDGAMQFSDELGKCALNSKNPASIQAICLSNMELLAETYPKLENQFLELKERASREAVRLLDE